jgi:hypothetical protein
LKKGYSFHPLRDALLLMRSLLRLWRHYSSTSISYYEYVSWLDEGDLVVRKVNRLRTLQHYEHKTTPKRPIGFVGYATLRIPQDTYREGMAKTTTALLYFGSSPRSGQAEAPASASTTSQYQKSQERRPTYPEKQRSTT